MMRIPKDDFMNHMAFRDAAVEEKSGNASPLPREENAPSKSTGKT